MSRLLILILGTMGIFMLLPEISAEAKLTSSGQGQADRTPSDVITEQVGPQWRNCRTSADSFT